MLLSILDNDNNTGEAVEGYNSCDKDYPGVGGYQEYLIFKGVEFGDVFALNKAEKVLLCMYHYVVLFTPGSYRSWVSGILTIKAYRPRPSHGTGSKSDPKRREGQVVSEPWCRIYRDESHEKWNKVLIYHIMSNAPTRPPCCPADLYIYIMLQHCCASILHALGKNFDTAQNSILETLKLLTLDKQDVDCTLGKEGQKAIKLFINIASKLSLQQLIGIKI
ncbi:hypothetical protein BJX70DRAFT_384800 [Aspergillus crustosus]